MAIRDTQEVEGLDQLETPADLIPKINEPITEAPAPAGVSALREQPTFIDGEEFMVAMGPGMRKILTHVKPPPSRPLTDAATPITIKKLVDAPEPEPRFIDPDTLSPAEAAARADNEATKIIESDLADFDTSQTHIPNFHVINNEEQGLKAIGVVAESARKEINKASRRGPDGEAFKDAQVLALAESLGTKPEFVMGFLQRKLGEGVNAETILAARMILEASAKELKRLANEIYKGDAGDRTKVEFLSQFDFHRQWMAQFMGARAEVGRAMRSLNTHTGFRDGPSGPHQQKPFAEVPANRLEEVVNHWGGQMDINTLAERIVKNDTHLGINTTVQAQAGGMNKYGAAFIESFVGSLLSGIKTQFVNITGNALMTIKGPIEVAIAARLGRNLPSDADQVFVGEAQAMLFGMYNGFKDALHSSWSAFKTGQPYGDTAKFELGHNKAISSEAMGYHGVAGWLLDVYGPIARFPMERFLGPMDAFFKVINERAAFAQLAYREAMRQGHKEGLNQKEILERLATIMENPDAMAPGMMQDVFDYGLYTTFQNPLGPLGQKIQGAVNQNAALKIIAPFVRTPLNILKVGFIDSSPFGLLKLVSKEYRDAINPKPDEFGNLPRGAMAKAQIMRARIMFGSTVMGLFAMYSMSGRITGSGPRDPDEQAAWRSTGWEPRSIRMDNPDGTTTWVSYGRYEPMSLLMGTVADIVDMMRVYQWDDLDKSQEQKFSDAIAAVTYAIAENTINKTYLQGVNDSLKGLDNPWAYGERWITNIALGAVPLAGLRRDIRKVNDGYMREANGFVEKLMNGTPYFSKMLPKKLDVWGETIEYQQFMNPNPWITSNRDDLDIEVERLMLSTGKVPIRRTGKKAEGTIQLTSQQVHDWLLTSRKLIKLDADGNVWLPGDPMPHEGQWYNLKEYLRDVRLQSSDYWEQSDYLKIKEMQVLSQALDLEAYELLKQANPELAEESFRLTINDVRRNHGDHIAREEVRKTGKESWF